jgi:hypothetical protein
LARDEKGNRLPRATEKEKLMNPTPVRSSENTRWMPYVLPWDDAPLDLSFLYADEKPAGRHGFLKVKGTKFFFEDGTEGKFWGTCFNSAANFPSHEHSEKVARRLAKFGVNMMRPHQMDAEWSTPNIFQFARGRRRDDSRSLDPESLDRFDYLVHCLKREGIYIYMDNLTYRRFKPGDGVDAVDELGCAAKPYTIFDRRLIELQKEFCTQLWTHVNPYTGLAYKDDPAVVLTEIGNENDLFIFKTVLEPYRTRLEERYRAWAAESGVKLPDARVDFTVRDEAMMRFFSAVQKEYYREMSAHLRAIGVRVPITGNNWEHPGFAEVAASEECDFRDSHCYWDMWSDTRAAAGNQMMLAQKQHVWGNLMSRARLLNQPFFVSEWDQIWPNEWRAESPLMLAAMSSFQEWSGTTIHTYRYRTSDPKDRMGAVVMYGVGYRVNFDTFNDPAKFGLFYHAALLFRKGHVAPARKSVGLMLRDRDIFAPTKKQTDPLAALSELHKVGLILPGQTVSAEQTITRDDPAPAGGQQIKSDTGELCRDLERKLGWIDTAHTKAAYGMLGKAGEVALGGLKLKVKTPFAVVALSSLEDAPLERSANILLTAVGRADNSGARYNEDHTERFYVGDAPVLIEVIEAEIELKTSQPALRVFAIDPDGFITDHAAAKIEGGVAKFVIGGKYPSMYYLIQRVG